MADERKKAPNSAFQKLLDDRGVLPNDPLRFATPQMLAGEDPRELMAAAIARSQAAQQVKAMPVREEVSPFAGLGGVTKIERVREIMQENERLKNLGK